MEKERRYLEGGAETESDVDFNAAQRPTTAREASMRLVHMCRQTWREGVSDTWSIVENDELCPRCVRETGAGHSLPE